MTESTDPQTPEEAAALRTLAATHRRRHWWVALLSSVVVSVPTTLILHTIWHDWPLDARDLGLLVFFVVNAFGGLGWLAWSLRSWREREAMDRQWKVWHTCWRAQRRVWHARRAERRGHVSEGKAR